MNHCMINSKTHDISQYGLYGTKCCMSAALVSSEMSPFPKTLCMDTSKHLKAALNSGNVPSQIQALLIISLKYKLCVCARYYPLKLHRLFVISYRGQSNGSVTRRTSAMWADSVYLQKIQSNISVNVTFLISFPCRAALRLVLHPQWDRYRRGIKSSLIEAADCSYSSILFLIFGVPIIPQFNAYVEWFLDNMCSKFKLFEESILVVTSGNFQL